MDPGACERGAVYLPSGYPVRVPNVISDEPTCRCRRAAPKLLRGNLLGSLPRINQRGEIETDNVPL